MIAYQANEFSFRDVYEYFLFYKKYVILILFLCISLGYGFYDNSKPVYKSHAYIVVKRRGGEENYLDFTAITHNKLNNIGKNIDLLTSRTIIESGLDDLELIYNVKPYGLESNLTPEDQLIYMYKHASPIRINSLNYDGVLKNKKFYIKIIDEKRFSIVSKISEKEKIVFFDENQSIDLNGEKLSINFSLTNEIYKGKRFVINRIDFENYFSKNFRVEEKPLKSGVIKLTLISYNYKFSVSVINSILESYIVFLDNIKILGINQSIDYVEEKILEINESIRSKHLSLDEMWNSIDSIDVQLMEGTAIIELAKIDALLSNIANEKSELLLSYTNQHPKILALDNFHFLVSEKKRKIEKKIESFPLIKNRLSSFSRDIGVETSIYNYLRKKHQDLQLIRSGVKTKVRIIDDAFPIRVPINANFKLYIVASISFGFFLSLFFIILMIYKKDVFSNIKEVDSSDYIERIPLLRYRDKSLLLKAEIFSQIGCLLTNSVEVNSINKLKIILISSSHHTSGTSYISDNISKSMANTNVNVLKITFQIKKKDSNTSKSYPLIVKGEVDNLFLTEFLVDADQINNSYIAEFLSWLSKLSKKIDYFIIDAPPIHTSAFISKLSKYVSLSLMIVQKMKTKKYDHYTSLRILHENKSPSIGILFNEYKR